MSRSKAARFLVELGTPTGVYDHNGEMTLSLLILKMPEVATIALDQFRSQDMINRKEYTFLNYVEGPRVWENSPRENKARSPLEVAIQYEQYCIVMHPVMKRLINVKWEFFGKKGAQIDLIVNVAFAFVWTIIGITIPLNAAQLYWPLRYVTLLEYIIFRYIGPCRERIYRFPVYWTSPYRGRIYHISACCILPWSNIPCSGILDFAMVEYAIFQYVGPYFDQIYYIPSSILDITEVEYTIFRYTGHHHGPIYHILCIGPYHGRIYHISVYWTLP